MALSIILRITINSAALCAVHTTIPLVYPLLALSGPRLDLIHLQQQTYLGQSSPEVSLLVNARTLEFTIEKKWTTRAIPKCPGNWVAAKKMVSAQGDYHSFEARAVPFYTKHQHQQWVPLVTSYLGNFARLETCMLAQISKRGSFDKLI